MHDYQNPKLTSTERAVSLLSLMTLREKAAQTAMLSGVGYATKIDKHNSCSVEPDTDYDWNRLGADFGDAGIGYIHDNYSQPSAINRLQRYFVGNTRLGIPCIFTGEALHGICGTRGTVLPSPPNWAATFDSDLVRECGDVIGTETRALGIHEILAPNLDVARDPRWGRTEETFGEDTYLSSRMAVAVISGEQKGDISRNDAVIAEPKHYCVHGIPEGGINCAPARAGIREVESCYLPVFEAGIREGGAYDVMVSYNSVDGDLLMTSRHFLRDVLKNKLGLRGICRSDWGGVGRIADLHHLTSTKKDAVRMAMANGLDAEGLDIPPSEWIEYVTELVSEGKLPEDRLNDAVLRILMLKFSLGLFEQPYTDENRWSSLMRSAKHLDVALRTARESVTLLKNNGILPLGRNTIRKIALIGPSADDQKIGGYSSTPVGYRVRSVREELQKLLPETEILYARGCAITSEAPPNPLFEQRHLRFIPAATEPADENKAIEIASESELIIFVGGDDRISSGEGRDRCELTLCGGQRALIKKLAALGKPLVLVLENGKPLEISEESELSDAILECWFGGELGAQAIAEALTGAVNPAGRLPFSLPRHSTMIPCYYTMLPGGSNMFLEGRSDPLYPFGHGMSYTEFEYSDMTAEPTGTCSAHVSVTVRNIGSREGDEVVQIYVDDLESSVVLPRMQLKSFSRIHLIPGEAKTLTFELGHDAFRLMNADYKWTVEPGSFRIIAAASSADIRAEATIVLEGSEE